MGQEEERDEGVCVCAYADLCGLLRPGFMLPQTCREKTLALLQRTFGRKKGSLRMLLTAVWTFCLTIILSEDDSTINKEITMSYVVLIAVVFVQSACDKSIF